MLWAVHDRAPHRAWAQTMARSSSRIVILAQLILSASGTVPPSDTWYRKNGIGRFFKTDRASGISTTGASPPAIGTRARQRETDGFLRMAPNPYRTGPARGSSCRRGSPSREAPRPAAGTVFPSPSSSITLTSPSVAGPGRTTSYGGENHSLPPLTVEKKEHARSRPPAGGP